MLGKIEGGRRRKWEDEMVGWHHQLDGHEFEQAPGSGDGQGGLMCCSPWGHKELDTTEQMNWADFLFKVRYFCDKLLNDENKLLKLYKFSPLKSVACLNGNNNKVKNVYILHEIDSETYQAPPPMGFSRQEYWSGMPLPSPLIKSDSFNIANPKKLKKFFFRSYFLVSCPASFYKHHYTS